MRSIHLLPPARVAGLLAGAALLIGACSATAATSAPSAAASGSSGSASPAASASAVASAGLEVDVAQAAKLGPILTGAGGRTLYAYKKDSGGTSACTGKCAANWPPLTLGGGAAVTAGAGVMGTFGTITRADGSTQVTYDGAPLYYFKGDQKAGDVNGEGIGGVWFAETPSGATAAGSPSPAAGGYGG